MAEHSQASRVRSKRQKSASILAVSETQCEVSFLQISVSSSVKLETVIFTLSKNVE